MGAADRRVLSQQRGITPHGIRQQTSHDGTKERGDVEADREDQEGARVILLLLDVLGDHGPDDAHGAVDGAAKRTPEHGLRERRRKCHSQTRHGGAEQTDEQDKLASAPFGVGDSAPGDGGRELGGSEGALEDAGLGRDVGVGQVLIEGLELIEHVRLQRCDLQEVKDATEAEQGELTLAGEGHPCHGRGSVVIIIDVVVVGHHLRGGRFLLLQRFHLGLGLGRGAGVLAPFHGFLHRQSGSVLVETVQRSAGSSSTPLGFKVVTDSHLVGSRPGSTPGVFGMIMMMRRRRRRRRCGWNGRGNRWSFGRHGEMLSNPTPRLCGWFA